MPAANCRNRRHPHRRASRAEHATRHGKPQGRSAAADGARSRCRAHCSRWAHRCPVDRAAALLGLPPVKSSYLGDGECVRPRRTLHVAAIAVGGNIQLWRVQRVDREHIVMIAVAARRTGPTIAARAEIVDRFPNADAGPAFSEFARCRRKIENRPMVPCSGWSIRVAAYDREAFRVRRRSCPYQRRGYVLTVASEALRDRAAVLEAVAFLAACHHRNH